MVDGTTRTWSWQTASDTETEAVGAELADLLEPGDVLLLIGPMGSGKTKLTRGLARALGIDAAQVQSPTFTLVNEYRAGGGCGHEPVLIHVDLYRLEPEETLDLGLDELFEAGALVVIEWADRLAFAVDLPGRRVVTLELTPVAEDVRSIVRVSSPPVGC